MKNGRILALCAMLLLSVSISLHAQSVNLGSHRVSLKAAFEKIEKASKYKIAYNSSLVDANRIVNVSNTKGEAIEVLRSVLSNAGYSYEVNGNYITVKPQTPKQKQVEKKESTTNRKVTGKVVDEEGEPIIGASIVVKGTKIATVSDIDGNYTLNNVPEDAEISISYIGFTPLNYKASDNNLAKVTLQEATKGLNEVVVIGYGTQLQTKLTSAVGSIKGSQLDNIANGTIASMQGTTPGLTILDKGGSPGRSSTTMRVRGVTTINNSDALILVDGVEQRLDDLNPDDIDNISILKDAAATAIYGSRAANGIVLVTTKRAKRERSR